MLEQLAPDASAGALALQRKRWRAERDAAFGLAAAAPSSSWQALLLLI
jgi:hypothetical protein